MPFTSLFTADLCTDHVTTWPPRPEDLLVLPNVITFGWHTASDSHSESKYAKIHLGYGRRHDPSVTQHCRSAQSILVGPIVRDKIIAHRRFIGLLLLSFRYIPNNNIIILVRLQVALSSSPLNIIHDRTVAALPWE